MDNLFLRIRGLALKKRDVFCKRLIMVREPKRGVECPVDLYLGPGLKVEVSIFKRKIGPHQ